ncbi:hypothetical protein D3C76_1751060 [compost metagenome]
MTPGGRKRSATVISIGGRLPPASPCKVRNTIRLSRFGANGQRIPSTVNAPIALSVKRRREKVTEHQGANAMAETEVAA